MTLIDKKYTKLQELPWSILSFGDLYKDIIYIRRFVHFYKYCTFLLYFSITAPYAMTYLLLNLPDVSNTSLYQALLIYFRLDKIIK